MGLGGEGLWDLREANSQKKLDKKIREMASFTVLVVPPNLVLCTLYGQDCFVVAALAGEVGFRRGNPLIDISLSGRPM